MVQFNFGTRRGSFSATNCVQVSFGCFCALSLEASGQNLCQSCIWTRVLQLQFFSVKLCAMIVNLNFGAVYRQINLWGAFRSFAMVLVTSLRSYNCSILWTEGVILVVRNEYQLNRLLDTF
jgi:quinol-cytochrome oxidoreductase complex cytochrome b subunit